MPRASMETQRLECSRCTQPLPIGSREELCDDCKRHDLEQARLDRIDDDPEGDKMHQQNQFYDRP